jgi:hypothetical protein
LQARLSVVVLEEVVAGGHGVSSRCHPVLEDQGVKAAPQSDVDAADAVSPHVEEPSEDAGRGEETLYFLSQSYCHNHLPF